MLRSLPEESNRELLKQLFSALKEEFIVIHCGIPLTLSFGLLVLLGIYLFRSRGKKQSNKNMLIYGNIFVDRDIILWSNCWGQVVFQFYAPG